MLLRVTGRIADGVVQWHYFAPRRAPSEILQHVATDRQQPGAKLTLPAKAVHTAKRADEGLLDQIIHIRIGRSRAGQKPRQWPAVASDELGRRVFVAVPPCSNKGGIGRRIGSRQRIRHWLRLSVDVKTGPILRRCLVSGVRCLGYTLRHLTPDTR